MFRTPTLRRLAPVALFAACTLLLTSCGEDDKKGSSPSDEPSASASTTADPSGCDIDSGETSDSVNVAGDFGKQQTADFKTPLKATDLERTVVTKGSGADVEAGQSIDVLLSVYLGKDGKSLGTQPAAIGVGDANIPPAFAAGVKCLSIGSRVVVTVPAADVYGPKGNPNVGIAADDTMIIVTDVIGLSAHEWTKHAPAVKFDSQGKPTLKLPDTKPPADLLIKVLRPGTGDVVKAGDTVTLDYQGTNWKTGKIFDQSYGKKPASFATNQVVQGFGIALVGQKVGTRLVVSIPPRYGYGEKGNGNTSELAGQTLVFVIEIQKTAATPAQ